MARTVQNGVGPCRGRGPRVLSWSLLAFSLLGCNQLLDLERGRLESFEAGVGGDPGCDAAGCGDGCAEDGCVPDGHDAAREAGPKTEGPDDGGPQRGEGGVDAGDAGEGGAPQGCGSSGCGANAECVARAGEAPQCECHVGYGLREGACRDIDECVQPERGGCAADADCENTPGGFTCRCRPGFADQSDGAGTRCVSLCELADCLPELATCAVVDGRAECTCLPAYVGDGRTACELDTTCRDLACDPQTEQCEVEGASRRCACKPGYERQGEACVNPDDCDPNPCENGGACHDGLDSFSCDCLDGFGGERCEVNVNECAPRPCKHGATCVDLVNDYRCECPPGYTGKDCQQDVDECADSPCQHGGTCHNLPGSFRCDCQGTGYAGPLCDADLDECTGREVCGAEARCVDEAGGHRCVQCGAGFEASADGTACVDVDECADSPCQHGGRCINSPGGFSCSCPAAWTGANCELDVDECTGREVCGASARCVNRDGSFDCVACADNQIASPDGAACVCARDRELCNGQDDDCDGETDEDWALGGACSRGVGACEATGEWVCDPSGVGRVCSATPGPRADSDATCDGVDDDCDSSVDEDYRQSCASEASTRSCEAGRVVTRACPANQSCVDGVCGGECAPGQTRCLDRTTLQVCRGGRFVLDRRCPGVGGVCVAGACLECQDGQTRCDGPSRMFVCRNNTWGVSRPCLGQTCLGDVGGVGGACTGSCGPEERVCLPQERAWVPCGADGELDTSQPTRCAGNPVANASWEVCREGRCVESPQAQAGPTDAEGWDDSIKLPPNAWLVTNLVLDVEVRVTEMHAVFASAPSGTTARMALWQDNGENKPGRRLIWTPETGIHPGDSRFGSRVLTLRSNTRYWIGLNVSGEGTTLRSREGHGDYNLWYEPPTTDVGATPPAQFGDPGFWERNSRDFGLFVTGREVL